MSYTTDINGIMVCLSPEEAQMLKASPRLAEALKLAIPALQAACASAKNELLDPSLQRDDSKLKSAQDNLLNARAALKAAGGDGDTEMKSYIERLRKLEANPPKDINQYLGGTAYLMALDDAIKAYRECQETHRRWIKQRNEKYGFSCDYWDCPHKIKVGEIYFSKVYPEGQTQDYCSECAATFMLQPEAIGIDGVVISMKWGDILPTVAELKAAFAKVRTGDPLTCPQFKTCSGLGYLSDTDITNRQFSDGAREVCAACVK